MAIYYFNTEQFLPIDIDASWDFFSSAKHLALITPPEMDFKILSKLHDREIFEGMIIDYTVKPLFNIKVKWQTEIGEVNKPDYFVDRQVKGPYKVWEHKHIFIKKDNGVMIKDEVKYQLPFGMIGDIAHQFLIRKKIENIFIYRKHVLLKMFATNENLN